MVEILRHRKVLTVCVDARATGRYIGGQREIWRPQIFNVNVTESFSDRLVEATTGEHRRYRIR